MAEHSSSSTPRCVLDDNSCLSLHAILSSFNTPINEEQAWAVCYQCAKCLQKEWEKDQHACFVLNDLGQIFIHKDGIIHPNTKSVSVPGKSRTKPSSEEEFSSSLGFLIFHALDYGLAEDVERPLSGPLEHLIEMMTSTNGNTSNDQDTNRDCDRHDADEGIERDSEEYEASDIRLLSGISFAKVMEVCASHLHIPSQADSHYKAVCRALVAEALELSSFLEKITQGKEELNELRRNTPDVSDGADLEALKFSDWARLWVQVIRDLRHGVKLKKVVIENLPPNEYELTPYEILMDDIRSRRYKLNKVMVNGDIPQKVKKDAHAVILEFIRSRPPLHPVSSVAERKLKPIKLSPTSPYEALMKSIRQKHRLKKIPVPKTLETSRTQAGENDATPQSTRRLIKVDMSLIVDTDDDDDLELPSSPCDEGKKQLTFEDDYKLSARNRKWKRTVALDLANEASLIPERRHSITVCESPVKPPNGGSGEVVVSPTTTTFIGAEQPVSLPVQLSTCETITLKTTTLFFQSKKFKNSMECLSLTLEEVVHIRNVLTKAELESLLVDKNLYEGVSKGKVCFTCKKTKFSLFGSWGQKCRLCQRNVCEKCCTKMRIPTEHFASIPVFTLSPGSTSSTEDDSTKSVWKLPDVSSFLNRRMSVGSAPSSPNLSRKNGHPIGSPSSVSSSPIASPLGTSIKRRPLLRSRTLNRADSVRREKLCGELMTVCKECRAVVKHAIVANRQSLQLHQKKVLQAANGNMANGKSSPSSSRRMPPSRDLHLNLAPIY
uniref:KIND domain-containing protein n=1 Tax=Strigamia maritima TaxID=126957 RepID=T1J523_STRMM